MGGASLEGVDLKLDRADEHLAFLQDKVGAFVDEGRTIVCEFDADTSECVLSIAGEPPPVTWGVRLSEWAHLTRSALDNLYWQVIRSSTGAFPTGRKREERPSFPIHKDKGSFQDGEVQLWVNQLVADHRTFLEEAQPYKARGAWRERHPLYLLSELNNIDKHRFFHVGYAALTVPVLVIAEAPTGLPEIEIRMLPQCPGTRKIREEMIKQMPGQSLPGVLSGFPGLVLRDCKWRTLGFTSGASDNRAEIMRVGVIPTGPNPQVEMQPTTPIEVSLSNPEIPVTTTDITDIRNRVHEIVGHFRVLF